MMKKLLVLFVIASLLVGCTTKNTTDKNILTVSIDPQKFFLEALVGDKYTVNTLIPAGANPESYDPTPSQMIALGKSDIYFKVGYLSFENVWVKNVQENTPQMQIVDCSQGIEALGCSGHGHSHDDHNHAGHEGEDPHIWSSPRTAKIMVGNMYNALVAADAENKDYYTTNYTKLVNKIDSVDSVIRTCLDKADGRGFIIYHPALSYFALEYDLNQLSIEHEGKSPSPAQLRQLIDLAKEQNIKVVFIQAEYDQKNAEIIAREIGAKVVSINLLSYNWEHEMIKIVKSLITEGE